MQRRNAGYEEVKIGGAVYVWLKYHDADGFLLAGDYYKWADGDDSDGARSLLLASTSLLITAVFALF